MIKSLNHSKSTFSRIPEAAPQALFLQPPLSPVVVLRGIRGILQRAAGPSVGVHVALQELRQLRVAIRQVDGGLAVAAGVDLGGATGRWRWKAMDIFLGFDEECPMYCVYIYNII
jgi:hypothetical protein